MKPFQIYGRPIGLGHPCFVIAEAGSNHNGDLEVAKRLISAAHEAGADAVKFQTFKASKLYPRSAGRSDYLGSPKSIYDIIEAMEMPEAWLGELRDLTHSLQMAFISSPFHEEAVEVLAPYVDAFKVASYELTHEPLLRAVAAHKKPVIFSTGASRLEEAREAVELLRGLGCEELVALQCTAAYPAPPESAQVGALVQMREALGALTGLSDHTADPAAAPAAAAALGAVVVEKHYTLSKRLPGPDHAFAVEPHELAALVRAVRAAQVAVGEGRKFVHPVEGELRDFARRSLFTTRPLRAGERFSAENLDVLRQGKLGAGLSPAALWAVRGGVAARDLPEDHPLQAGDVAGVDAAALPRAGERPRAALRDAEERDLGLVWAWAHDPLTRAGSLRAAPIPYAEHRAWFSRRLEARAAGALPPGAGMWVVERGGEPVGFARLDAGAPGELVVSVHVSPGARGQGVAQEALEALAVRARAGGAARLVALVHPLNGRSVGLFEGAGFVWVGDEGEARRYERGV